MAHKDLNLKSTLNKPVHLEGDVWLVPCIANHSVNDFKPLLKPLDSSLNSHEYTRKHLWTSPEDETLKTLILTRGARSWSVIAREINSLIHNGLNIRQGRQCRERWFNHINPELNKGQWSDAEDDLLMSLQGQLGNKWSEISKELKGRTENAVKNRWKSLLKKKLNHSDFALENSDLKDFDCFEPDFCELVLQDSVSAARECLTWLGKEDLEVNENCFDEEFDYSCRGIC